MTWFKVDDSFYDHPKVFDAPDCAVALWIRAGTWSARNLTDGFVPAGLPARLCDDPDTAIKELVRRGLWTRASGGFRFHDWADYQPSKDAVEDLRSKRAEAGRRGGQAKAAAGRHRQAVDNREVGNEVVTTPQNGAAVTPLASARARGVTAGGDTRVQQTPSKPLASASPVAKQNSAPTRPGPSEGRVGGRGDLLGGQAVTREREEPPPPRCDRHLNDPNPPACGWCAEARRKRDAWDRNDVARRAGEARTAQRCRTHPGEIEGSCRGCRADSIAAPTGGYPVVVPAVRRTP